MWFNTGEDAYRVADKEEEDRARRAKDREEVKGKWWLYNRIRIWLKPGGEISITFVDDKTHQDGYPLPFVIKEHQVNIDGDWKNWFTCLNGLTVRDFTKILNTTNPDILKEEGIPVGKNGELNLDQEVGCPLCKMRERSYLMAVYTVLDHSEWEDKQGNVHKDEPRLLCVKSRIFKVIRKISSKKGGSLRGCKYDLSRTSKDSPNSGDMFDFIERKELHESIQPAPYLEVFKPKTPATIRALVGNVINTEEENTKAIHSTYKFDDYEDEVVPF